MTAAAIPEEHSGHSLWAVVAGFFSVAILSVARGQMLHET